MRSAVKSMLSRTERVNHSPLFLNAIIGLYPHALHQKMPEISRIYARVSTEKQADSAVPTGGSKIRVQLRPTGDARDNLDLEIESGKPIDTDCRPVWIGQL